MNRKIKFRAWHKTLEEMLNVYVISQKMLTKVYGKEERKNARVRICF